MYDNDPYLGHIKPACARPGNRAASLQWQFDHVQSVDQLITGKAWSEIVLTRPAIQFKYWG